MDEVNYETFDNKFEVARDVDQRRLNYEIIEDMIEVLSDAPMKAEELYENTMGTNASKTLLAVCQSEGADYNGFVKNVSQMDVFDVKFSDYDNAIYVGLKEEYRNSLKKTEKWINDYLDKGFDETKGL